MKTKEELNSIVYIIDNDNEVVSMSYADYLIDYGSDETTSPRGVAPRMHIREIEVEVYVGEDEDGGIFETKTEYQIWSWGIGGNNPSFTGDAYETEEEAELNVFERYEYNVDKNWDAPRFYDTEEDAEADRVELSADRLGVDVDVFISIDKKQKKIDNIKAERTQARK